MNREESLREIETNYQVENIKIGGESFWPFFRVLVYTELHRGNIRVHRHSPLDIFAKLKNALLGIRRWSQKHPYFFFSHELERKCIEEDYYIDKLNDKAIEILGWHKCTYVELIERRHLDKKSYGSKEVVSHDFLFLLFGIVKMFYVPIRRIRIEGEQILTQILLDYELSIDYKNKLKSFFAKQVVLTTLLRYQKTKAVFVSDYGSLYITYAAKRLGIPVAEFQHGVATHEYYHPSKELNQKFCPDFMLVFGTNDKEDLSHGLYVPEERIIPIGNYYLELMANRAQPPHLKEVISRYVKSVCVPTNRIVHDYHVSFIRDIAESVPEILFIVVPREGTAVELPPNLPANVILERVVPFQEVVGHCVFNTCTYSTCSIESLTLGTQNILIDEDGLTSHYLGKMLSDRRYTRFVKTREEYIQSLKEMEVRPKREIQESNFRNYAPNYDGNIKAALKLIIK